MRTHVNKYFAFISYKREDEEWAIWFHHELENYHLPISLNGRPDLPTEFRPIFRDIDELKAGNLPEQIYNALASSSYLIVICSPNSAKSKWVNKEITDFIEIGRARGIDNVRNIFPFIVEGHPHAGNKEECFPDALLNLQGKDERVGGNVNESGRDKAFVKILAGMLPDVDFDELWNRYERDKTEKERIERERKESLLRLQSKAVAEKASALVEKDSYLARMLMVEALPKDLGNPDRPYTLEAERTLRKACFCDSAILYGHGGGVTHVTYSPDGRYIACALFNSQIVIYNADSGAIIQVLEGASSRQTAQCVSYSPDGKLLVSSADDFTITMWDVTSGKVIWTIDYESVVKQVVFSPDGSCVAAVSQSGHVIFYDSKKGKRINALGFVNKDANAVAFSPNGKLFAVAVNGDVEIWDFSTGSIRQTIKGHVDGGIDFIAYSPDGKQVASASNDNTVGIWDAQTGKNLHVLKGHGSHVLSVAYSPDGKQVASASIDRLVKIWDVDTGEEIRAFKGHENVVSSVTYSPDGRRITSASWDDTVRIWDVDRIKEVHLIDCRGYGDSYTCTHVKSATYSCDGRFIIAILEGGLFLKWNAHSGEIMRMTQLYKEKIQYATFSSNGKRLFITTRGELSVWDVELEKELYCLSEYDISFERVFANDQFFISINDTLLELWNTDTGSKIYCLSGHASRIKEVSFSYNGCYFLSWSDSEDVVLVWNAITKKVVNSLDISHDSRISSINISPDGKYLVSSSYDRTVKIWNVKTGGLHKVLRGHSKIVMYATFSMDGKRIVSLDQFGENIIIWDVETGMEIHSVKKTAYYNGIGFESAIFNYSGNSLLLFNNDGNEHEIGIWSFPSLQELIDQTRERFKDRQLTQEEREQYYFE